MLRHVTHWSSLHSLSHFFFTPLRCSSPTTRVLACPFGQEATKREPVQGRASYISFDEVLDEDKLPFVPETERPEKTDERVRVYRPSSLLAAS